MQRARATTRSRRTSISTYRSNRRSMSQIFKALISLHSGHEEIEFLLAAKEELLDKDAIKEIIRDIELYLEDEAPRYNLCPKCGSELQRRRVCEKHPYGSTVAREWWVEIECDLCGWEVN